MKNKRSTGNLRTTTFGKGDRCLSLTPTKLTPTDCRQDWYKIQKINEYTVS